MKVETIASNLTRDVLILKELKNLDIKDETIYHYVNSKYNPMIKFGQMFEELYGYIITDIVFNENPFFRTK